MPNNANETATADASGGAENRLGASLIRPLIAAFDKGGLALVLLIVAAICIMIGGIGYIRNSSGITVPLAALSLVSLTNVYVPARKVIREIRANCRRSQSSAALPAIIGFFCPDWVRLAAVPNPH